MILGFTGTRDGLTVEQARTIDGLLEDWSPARLVHGGAPGADVETHSLARALRIPVDVYPAPDGPVPLTVVLDDDVTLHPPAPPLDRNRTIVAVSDRLLAAPRRPVEELRSGTWATIRYARRRGIPIVIVRPDGICIQDGTDRLDG